MRLATATAALTLALAAPAYASPGALTQLPGNAGCISDDGAAGEVGSGCDDTGHALDDAKAAVVSQEGANLYVASARAHAVASFFRQPDASLSQLTGTPSAGCISDNGLALNDPQGGICLNGKGLHGARSVAIGADHVTLYVAAHDANAVAVLDRQPDGSLSQDSATGCLSRSGIADGDTDLDNTCVNAKGVSGPASLAVSPDGANLYVAADDADGVLAFKVNADGTLAQLSGNSGCVSENGNANGDPNGGTCDNGKGLSGARSVALSPDGANVYVASRDAGGSVAVFSRGAGGALTQLTGTSGCLSDDGQDPADDAAGTCQNVKATAHASGVAVSADGGTVYVTSDTQDAIGVFHRNVDGSLTQLAGTAGCVSDNGSVSDPGGDGACMNAKGLDFAGSVSVSPDNATTYTSSSADAGAIAVFARNADGSLSQLAGAAGCVSNSGLADGDPEGGVCIDGKGLRGLGGMALAPDGASLYATAGDVTSGADGDGVAVFARELAPSGGGGTGGGSAGSGSAGGTGAGSGSSTGSGGGSGSAHTAVEILDDGTLHAGKHAVKVRIRCPSSAKNRCIGAMRLTTTKRYRASRRGKLKKQVLGSSGFSLRPGQTRTISIQLRSAVPRLLARYSRLRAKLTARVGESFDHPAITRASLTIR